MMLYQKLITTGLAATAMVTLGASAVAAQSYYGSANVMVYVQVQNTRGGNLTPSNFTVQVTGNNPSPSSFQGNANGTNIWLGAGSFSITAPAVGGYTSSFSGTCNGYLNQGQSASCTVIYADTNLGGACNTFYGNCNYFPYSGPGLSCSAYNYTVPAGTIATFNATGGGGTYDWMADGRTYLNVGPTFTHTYFTPGQQTVTVSSGGRTAVCSVQVGPQLQYGYTAPSYPSVPTNYLPNPYLTSYRIPGLPNTGFAPVDWAALGGAGALVMLMGWAFYPYAKRAFTA